MRKKECYHAQQKGRLIREKREVESRSVPAAAGTDLVRRPILEPAGQVFGAAKHGLRARRSRRSGLWASTLRVNVARIVQRGTVADSGRHYPVLGGLSVHKLGWDGGDQIPSTYFRRKAIHHLAGVDSLDLPLAFLPALLKLDLVFGCRHYAPRVSDIRRSTNRAQACRR